MEAQIKTHSSPCGVCDGLRYTKTDFLSEQFGIIDLKISPIMTRYNRHISDHSTKVLILLQLKQERIM
jgi:hypothetical protein